VTDWTQFIHKFKNSPIILPISHEEKTKDVLFKKGGILLIHCETTGAKEYIFTICVEYAKAAFHPPTFVKSLQISKYESLLKEVESQVDSMMWINKDSLWLGKKQPPHKLGNYL
jgi:hypothetical protein